MSASNPLINSPHAALGRHSHTPYPTRPKRSNSTHFEGAGPRAIFEAAPRMHDISEESTFIPTSLAEHLLERTYLDDVVRPLVRALVKARMTYGLDGEGLSESSQAYADLEKLRRELERSAQRARNAELERDDLARRLDLAGVPDRNERHADHMGPGDHDTPLSRGQQPPVPAMLALKRPRPSDPDSIRTNYEQRSGPPCSTDVSVNVAHGDGPGASITVTTEGSSAPPNLTSRPHPGSGAEHLTPHMPYAHPAAPRHRLYSDMHHDLHDSEQRHLGRMALEADYTYGDDRSDRYAMPHSQLTAHRSGPARFGGMSALSPSGTSSYLTSGSERSSLPTLATFPSTSSSSSFSATPYSIHAYEHELDDVERSRKIARLRPGETPLDHASHSLGPGHNRPLNSSNNYLTAPPTESPSAYPIRKLASTKNRTCSNCAAPHDAKFRRGPNGPGTLCDRCGSRWKKFKEQESANRHEHREAAANASAASAAAAAHARLSSTSSSSQSPMEQGSAGAGENARTSESSLPLLTGENSNGRPDGEPSSAHISPKDASAVDSSDAGHVAAPSQRERERSASVDQLIDD